MSAAPPDPSLIETLHSSCVGFGPHAVLIRGASGSGKSALALQLMALGGDLVSDDRTRLWAQDGQLWADAPDTIRGMIEARGTGILRAPAAGPRTVALVVDMDRAETTRLPEPDHVNLAGIDLPLIKKSDTPHFYAAVALYLRHNC